MFTHIPSNILQNWGIQRCNPLMRQSTRVASYQLQAIRDV